jgi:hypothetical protein
VTASKQPKDAKVKAAAKRSLEKALLDERTAIAAVVKVMLIEVPDPQRALARLDAMARAAQGNVRYSPGIRQGLIDAARFVRRAVQQEQGKQQSLLDPPKPEPSRSTVDALVTATNGPQQLGLMSHGSTTGDVEEAHEQRVGTIAAVHTALVSLLKDDGAGTDRELYARYALANQGGALPHQSEKSIRERRRELFAVGRLRLADRRPSGEPVFDIVERDALERAS